MRRLRSSARFTRGFTLVELMIVVVIMSVLATLAVYGTSRYIASSKTSEAVQMIGSIKAGEEAYKDETFGYLKVTDSLSSYYPQSPNYGQYKVQWGGAPTEVAAKWATLGVNPSGPVLFGYACVAGAATDTMPAPGDITIGNWPSAAPGAPWYVVKAIADLDAGGVKTVYVGASFTTQIFSANAGE